MKKSQTMWMTIWPDGVADWELLDFVLADCVDHVNDNHYPRMSQKELEAMGYKFVQVTVTIKEK